MIASSFWIDPKTGNDYMLTVQYPETQIRIFDDLRAIPVRGKGMPESTGLTPFPTLRASSRQPKWITTSLRHHRRLCATSR